jgi:uncharacterized repeat protein (TIGR03803 family)
MPTPTIVPLFSFDTSSGDDPAGALVVDAAGDLYGSTTDGGPNGDGTIFEVNATTHNVTILSTEGVSELTVDPAGDVFGVVLNPSGRNDATDAVIELAHGSSAMTTLATVPAYLIVSGIAVNQQGAVFGVTEIGGTFDSGSIFEVAPGQNTAKTVASFPSSDSLGPMLAPTFDAAGNLFGTSGDGSYLDPSSPGVMYYELPVGTHNVHPVARFPAYVPVGPITSDAAGNLFGMSLPSFVTPEVSIFESVAGTHAEKTLATFTLPDQTFLRGGLLVDGAGDLFGSYQGSVGPDGVVTDGAIFELKAGSHTINLVATFDGTNGLGPVAGFTADAAGDLFGISGNTLFEVENSGFVPLVPIVPIVPTSRDSTRVVLQGYHNVVTGPYSATPGSGNAGASIFGPAAGGATIRGTADSEMIQAFGLGDTILANGGDDTILAGTGEATVAVSDTDGANAISGGEGDATITLGNGDNHIRLGGAGNAITLGNGNDLIVSGAGSATILEGNGNDRVTLGGLGNTVSAGNGNDAVSGGSGYDTVTLGNGRDAITESGYGNTLTVGNGNDTIIAGAGADHVTIGDGDDVVTLGGYGNSISGGDGNTKILGSASEGGNTVSLGDGNDNLVLGGANNTITLGAGTNTVVAGSGQDTVVAGPGDTNVTLRGDANSVTFNTGSNTVTTAGSDDVIRLDGGNARLLLGGSGDIVFLGGASAKITDAARSLSLDVTGGGEAFLQGFNAAGGSVLDLLGSPYTSASIVLGHLTDDHHGGSVLMLGADSLVDFAGLAPAAFSAANFKIG